MTLLIEMMGIALRYSDLSLQVHQREYKKLAAIYRVTQTCGFPSRTTTWDGHATLSVAGANEALWLRFQAFVYRVGSNAQDRSLSVTAR